MRFNIIFFSGLLITGLLFNALSAEKKKEGAITLKLSHNLSQSHSVHMAFLHMQKNLEEVSGGHMTLRIYPSGQMGESTSAIQLLQIGALDLAKATSSDLEQFESAYALFSLPFLFEDETHFNTVIQGDVGIEIMGSTRPKGFFGIGSYVGGYRSFYAKKPICTPDDLKGMKVRVQVSPMNLEMIRLMGGSATPMAFGEVYTALQQGVVDAAENNEPSWLDTRHNEVTPILSETRHLLMPDFLVISTHTWNRLTAQQKEWLMTAVSLSEQYQREQWATFVIHARNQALSSGATILSVDRAPFQKSVMPLYEKFRAIPKHRYLLNKTLQRGKT